MIDIENAVFNTVASTLRTELLSTYPKMKIYGEYVEYPEDFPCVSLWCTDNYTHLASRELGTTAEKYADMMFTTEVYTVGDGKKALAKKLANRVDELLCGMGMTRSAMMVLPNVDRNAFRITMRHSGLVQAPIGDNTSLTSLIYR